MRGISWAGASQSQALANTLGANRDAVRHWRLFKQMPMRTLFRQGVPKALLGRAVVRPAMRFLTAFGVGAIQIGAFLIIIELGVAAGRYAWSHMKQGMSIRKARRNLSTALGSFYAEGREVPKECDMVQQMEIEDEEVLRQVRENYGAAQTEIGFVVELPQGGGYLVEECNDNHEQNDQWFYGLFQNYSTALKQHRQFLTSPISTILTNWSEYFGNANNMHKASYHFYGDILGQINAKRDEKNGEPLLQTQGGWELDRSALLNVFAEEKYPAFRSHPLFGVRPHDKIKTTIQKDERGRAAIPNWNGPIAEEHQHALWQLNAQKSNLRHISNYVAQILESSSENLSPGLNYALRDIYDLVSSDNLNDMADGLILLSDHNRTFSLNHYMCEDPDLEQSEVCLLRDLQRQLSSPLYTAALLIDNRIEENRVREEDRAELSQISTLLKSNRVRDRNKAIERLLELFDFTSRETFASCLTNFESNNCATAEAITALDDSLPFSYRVRPEFGGYYNVHNANDYRENGQGYRGLEHGPLPLGMGNRYLMEYDNNFAAANVDFNWYPPGENASSMRSMGHYLMTNMLCGGDTMEHNDVSITSDNFLLIFPRRNVRFVPPKIPLTTDRDPTWFLDRWMNHDSYEYCGDIRNANNPKALWTKIPGSPDSKSINGNREHYQGLMDLLYHETHSGVLGANFEDWWNRVALNPIANQVETKTYAVNNFLFQKSVELLNDDYPFHNFLSVGEQNNLTESVIDELEFYFEKVFDPILETPSIDFTPTSISDELANGDYPERKAYMDQYWSNLKSELINGLREISESLKFSQQAARRAREDFFSGPWEKFWYLFQTYRSNEKQLLLDSREGNDGRFKHPIITYKPYERGGALELPQAVNNDNDPAINNTDNEEIVAFWKNARVAKILIKQSIGDMLEVANLVYEPDQMLDDSIDTVDTVPMEFVHNPELAEALAEQNIPEGMGAEEFMTRFLGINLGEGGDVAGMITLDEHMVNILNELGFDPADPDPDTISQMFSMISDAESGAGEDSLPPPEEE
jgi:hypothetical protein